ncbi:MAG: exo-alpha-sialidase [Cyclobacteriaceae bacterium]|nr:exo-alpha-sialidase [Cyclobacteriaceae bacterium]
MTDKMIIRKRMQKFQLPAFLSGMLLLLLFTGCQKEIKDPVITSMYIYDTAAAKTPQCHASTIAASGEVLIAAWFGGTHEKNKDVGIWLSRKEKEEARWSTPLEVVNGVQNDTLRYPCWNPVLFQPKEGPLMLFYKVGPSPREWWGMLATSNDQGKTWNSPEKLPKGILGPIKNKPVQLNNGDLLCPTSTEHDGWKVQMERQLLADGSWTTTGDLNDGKEIGAIQPAVLFHPDNRLQILCRTQQGFIAEAWSVDGGERWGAMELTQLPNPNSGIDALTLLDGRHLLVYNPVGENWGNRVPLTLAVSNDGNNWQDVLELESVTNADTADDEEYSYPAIIQTPDGQVHIVYTWNRQTVKYVVVDPAMI